jgi:trehalose 6-phosphate synthase
LQLVPGLVRDALPDAFLQYTVDVPWPGPEVWLMLPADWRDSIFKGILACDVVGFRSLRDRASFCHCVEGLVPGATVGPLQNSVEFRGRSTRLSVYRPTVDLDAVKARAESDDVLKETDPAGFDGSLHTFLTAERAEPFKNIVRSIRAYGYLLERRPELHTASRFLLLLAPAPPHLAQYRRYAEEIKRAANEVNGRHGGRGWQPVQLHFENNYAKVLAALSMFNTLVSVPIAESQCTTALTGPLINRREGTLILSESAGAAELIGQHAQLVSPTDVRGLAEAMERAFDMEVGDRKRMAECIAAAIGALTTEDVAARQLGDLLEVAKLKGGS